MNEDYQTGFPYLDSELGKVLEPIVNPQEKILWIGKPTFVHFVFRDFLNGLPLTIFGAAWVLSCILSDSRLLSVIGFFCFYLGIKGSVSRLFAYSKTVFGLSQNRILIATSGFGGLSFQTLDLKDVSEATVNVSVLERMFNVGSVNFFVGKTKTIDEQVEKVYDSWHSIENPYEVYQIIDKVICERKQRDKKPPKKQKHISRKSSGYRLDYE